MNGKLGFQKVYQLSLNVERSLRKKMEHPKPSDVRDRNSSSSNVNSDPLVAAIICLENAKSGTVAEPEDEI